MSKADKDMGRPTVQERRAATAKDCFVAGTGGDRTVRRKHPASTVKHLRDQESALERAVALWARSSWPDGLDYGARAQHKLDVVRRQIEKAMA